jgi:hypothetical protein
MACGRTRIRDGHSSGTPVTRRLQQPTRTARSRHDPEALRACAQSLRAVPIRSCSRWGLPCRRRYRRRGALLPHRFTLAVPSRCRAEQAVCSLWHFPWARTRRTLSGTVCPWSPDFPPRHPPPIPSPASGGGKGGAGAAVRPTDAGRDGVVGRRGQEASLQEATTKRSKLMTRAATVRGRFRWTSNSCKVARVEASQTPSMRSGRKCR